MVFYYIYSMFRFAIVLFLVSCAFAGDVRYSLTQFVEEGLAADPQVKELQQGTEEKKNQIRKLKAEAILPTFYAAMMVGPAPGLKEELRGGDTVSVYDFSRMGPFWGVQAKFIQPLNLGQYRRKPLKSRVRFTARMWNCRPITTTIFWHGK